MNFSERKAYLDSLARRCNLDKREVYVLSKLLGPSEDLDKLVSICQYRSAVRS